MKQLQNLNLKKLVRKKLTSAVRDFSKGIFSLMFCWISSYDAAYTIISVGVQHPYLFFFFLIAHRGSMMSSHLHPVPLEKSIGTRGGIEYGEDPDPSTRQLFTPRFKESTNT